VDRTIRTCSLALLLTVSGASAGFSKDSDVETDLYWQAQRAELAGNPASALKSYDRLLGKFPQSSVVVDRLFDLAVLQGDFPSALKAARAQQLSDAVDPALPLIFYVDAWKRKDWAEAAKATAWLQERGIFGFMAPLLNSWTQVAKGGAGSLANATLRDNGTLAYYSDDQFVYLDLANGNLDSAKRRLSTFPGFSDDYARHMALTAVEHLGRNGQAEFANSLLDHLGLESNAFGAKAAPFPSEQAIAALFSRLSTQLDEQGINEQALYFARLAQWIAPDSPFARITLAGQLAKRGQSPQASLLLDGVAQSRPQSSWALGSRARLLNDQGKSADALNLIQSARQQRPAANDLKLLEAQQLVANGDLDAAAAIYRVLVAGADVAAGKTGRRVTYRMLLAQVLDRQNNWPLTKAIYEEALAINDQNPQLLNSLGYGLLERREDLKRGFDLVSRAHRLAPQSPAITDSLGWAHYLNGNYESAIPLLERAVEDAINDVSINEHLGDAYWQVGRLHEARYAWRAAALQAEGEGSSRLATKIDLGLTEATAAP
jgi:tetratricopeptide (TPR) repeat protein